MAVLHASGMWPPPVIGHLVRLADPNGAQWAAVQPLGGQARKEPLRARCDQMSLPAGKTKLVWPISPRIPLSKLFLGSDPFPEKGGAWVLKFKLLEFKSQLYP